MYASRPPSPTTPQHSLPGGCYSLPGPDFHRLDRASFAWRTRTARRFTVYRTCPLATPEDRLFFLLTYLKTYAVQVVQGRLFGMGQSKANQWIHVLLPAVLAALRTLGDAPTRSLTALARRLGVSEGTLGVAPLEEPAPVALPAAAPVAGPAAPLLRMTGRNGASSAPRTRLNRRGVTAARKRTIT
jgi:Helix-turn-helix of DDE superfamily endonuclease